MHPAYSVIFLTTLIGAGQGLFLALYSAQLYSTVKLLPGQDPVQFYALGALVALVLLVLGLFASFFHLGRPERAWRTASMWRTSWLSREVIVLPAMMGVVAAWGLVHYTGWNPVLTTVGDGVPIDMSLLLGAAGTVVCFALFLCTGMIYACIKMLQEWATPLTVINYILLGGASGWALATAFAAWQGPGMVPFFGTWAIILTLAALVTRVASLLRNAKLKHKSDINTAIGIRHAAIEQKGQGAMAGSFNTREYFHGASERKYKAIKWYFLVLVFPVPLLLLAAGLSLQAAWLLLAAFLVQYVGLLLERWFFFAQANHPQNLYYQTV
ncbi:MAG: dimethyl sulfoxide reductase anchor subunit [Lysobacterales bacterium]|jgi:DMSO reductase anchor subunit